MLTCLCVNSTGFLYFVPDFYKEFGFRLNLCCFGLSYLHKVQILRDM